MVIFLLAVIAVGVLLLSDVGRTIIGSLLCLALIAVVLGIIAAACLVAWWAVEHWELQGAVTTILTFGAYALILLFGFRALAERRARKEKNIET
jgi:hypothetical protein